MTTYKTGDVVSFSKSQVSVLTVLSAAEEPYAVTLPIGDTIKTFTYDAPAGSTISSIAAGLLGVLQKEQTPFAVAPGTLAWEVLLAGPEGVTFEPIVTPNLDAALGSAAVLGRKPRHVLIIRPPRTVYTRQGEHTILVGRELESGDVFEFYADEVQVVIREGSGP